MHTRSRHRSQSGFSLFEVLVVVAVVALIGAGAVAVLSTGSDSASYVASLDRLQSFVALRRQEVATRNRADTFTARTDFVCDESVDINPPGATAPPGYVVTDVIRFEAGTGRPVDDAGRPRASAIILRSRSQSSPDTGAGLCAVAVSTTGVVTVWHNTNGSWSN